MADEIKQRIVLEGEKEYSAALKEANRNLKVLRSDLKAETAELGANATAQQKNEAKSRSLKKQIAEQEKIVATLKAALAEVKDKYGDNSEEVAKWEQKVNQARYALATMNNDLERTEQALKSGDNALQQSADAYDDAADAATGYADAADAASQIADQITFQNVIQAANNLTGKLQDAIGFVKDVGKAAWDWMTESGQWADELQTLSDKTDIDKQTLQGWRYAANFVDTEVDTITNAYVRLRDRTDGANEALASLGIVAQDNADPAALFWEVVDAVNAMDDATRKTVGEDALKTLFGKGYQEMMPLLKAGREGWEAYVKEASDKGLILSDEQIDKLTEFDDARIRMEESFNSLKLQIAEKLAPAFKTIADSLGEMVDKFIEWSNTEEGQKTLNNLGEALESIVTSLTGDIDFNDIVGKAQGAIEGLTGALGWISDNWGTVSKGIEGIALVLGGLKVSELFITALTLIKGIKWGSVAAAAGAGAGGTATTATATTATTAAAASSVTQSPGWGAALGAALKKSIPNLLAAWGTWELVKGSPVDTMQKLMDKMGLSGLVSKEERTLNEINKDAGIETLGEQMEMASGLGQDKTQKSMGLMWDTLIHPGKSSTDTAAEAAAAAVEEVIPQAEPLVISVPGGMSLTEAQRKAAEDFWDAWKGWKLGEIDEDAFDAASDALDEAFEGNDGLLNQLDSQINELIRNTTRENTWMDTQDLPTWWFTGPEGQLKDGDIQGFRELPGELQAAAEKGVAAGANGLRVELDGHAVGRIVAPYVSEMIASEM